MAESGISDEVLDKDVQFSEMGLDERLEKAVSKLNFEHPTLVQAQAIPLALKGKDILAKARTGSGKTAAYCIPVLQKLLSNPKKKPGVKAVILVPTKELVQQVKSVLVSLTKYCFDVVRVEQLNASLSVKQEAQLLMRAPDVLVATPARLLTHLTEKTFKLAETLQFLVLDEADLILSFGFQDDMTNLVQYLPNIYQAFLMSATLSDDITWLKGLILHNPLLLSLEDAVSEAQLKEFSLECGDRERFLIMYALLRLKLLTGKALIFVNTIDRCFKLKLFLDRFSIKSAVLNSELPQNSRYHIIQQFNQGLFDYLIATDESHDFTLVGTEGEDAEAVVETKSKKKDKHETQKAKRRKVVAGEEYGVHRGVDFKDVKTVVNFDLPLTENAYVHRIGRTARGASNGIALSFVTPKDTEKFDALKAARAVRGAQILPNTFKLTAIEGFRYRVEDVLRSITDGEVEAARKEEIRSEILNSEKLKSYFEDRPKELQLLQHDKPLLIKKVDTSLKAIPEYLVPVQLKGKVAKGQRGPAGKVINTGKISFPDMTGGYYKKQEKEDPLKTLDMTHEEKLRSKLQEAEAEYGQLKAERGDMKTRRNYNKPSPKKRKGSGR